MSKNYDLPLGAITKLRAIRKALDNIPVVGEVYAQQHLDTHLAASLLADDAIDELEEYFNDEENFPD
jgi:hypothetical protein